MSNAAIESIEAAKAEVPAGRILGERWSMVGPRSILHGGLYERVQLLEEYCYCELA